MGEFKIEEYIPKDELNWLDVHASVMVDSYAWWIVIHKKPEYDNETIDLVMKKDNNIVGFITTEINSKVIDFIKDDYGFVWEFGIHRDYRGLSLGKKLIDKTHQILREKYNINKSIWFSQDKRAQKYYEKLDMKVIERHWQFSVNPDVELKDKLLQKGFNCWNMRGECAVEEFEKVKEKFDLIEKDDALQPRLCIDYQYIP
jgi:ribosomal protein S18 acetylase RimI-like enzyme